MSSVRRILPPPANWYTNVPGYPAVRYGEESTVLAYQAGMPAAGADAPSRAGTPTPPGRRVECKRADRECPARPARVKLGSDLTRSGRSGT